jgi:uncharacterized linocin/CFP29 family protein
MDYFNRELAAFPLSLWGAIDAAAIKSARERLTARRFLDVEGPFGVGSPRSRSATMNTASRSLPRPAR